MVDCFPLGYSPLHRAVIWLPISGELNKNPKKLSKIFISFQHNVFLLSHWKSNSSTAINTTTILTLVRLYGSVGDGIGYSLNQDRPQVLRVMTRRGGTFSQLEKSKEWISLDICDFRSDLLLFNVETGNSYWKGRRSTVVLLLKIICLYKNIKKIYIKYKNQLILNRIYKEVNCTLSFPSARIPW